MRAQLGAFLCSAMAVSASWVNNINYRSPSEHHPGLGIALHKVFKRNDPAAAWDPAKLNFTHGVASGDPYADSVILWTRVAPAMDNDASNVTVSGDVPLYNHDTDEYVKASAYPVCVQWKIATDKCLSHVVDSGTAYTSSDIDYTIKVEAKKLKPFTEYYYQFKVCDSENKSPRGRTKTIPDDDDDVEEVRIAVYSCANYPNGFFNAYGNPARKDSVDFVVHLGDYIYEHANNVSAADGSVYDRVPLPNREIFTLYDFRKRHAIHKNDADLAASHQNFAWIPVWDDHEVADNTFRDGSSEVNNTEASFVKDGGVSFDQLKMNAVRAYFEWMPIRQVAMDDNLRIWRSFKIGKLADLIMLDTRMYDRGITDLGWNKHYIAAISDDAGRSLMGAHQEAWFYNELKESAKRDATWRIVGSQVMFTHLIRPTEMRGDGVTPLNFDSWDGYVSNRNRTLKMLYENNIGNNIFLAGDFHSNWVSDLAWHGSEKYPYNRETGEGAVGVELLGSAVSSPSMMGQGVTLDYCNNRSTLFYNYDGNAEIQWNELFYRGYFELTITPRDINAQFFGLPDITSRNSLEISLANFTVVEGANKLQRPVASGSVEAGTLRSGEMIARNLVFDTETGKYL